MAARAKHLAVGQRQEAIIKTLMEEVLAVATVAAIVLVGSLAFVTLTMPFVFPFVAVGAIAFAVRHRTKSVPGNPVGRPPRPARPSAGGQSTRPLAA
jgi:hypothetical protein